MPTSFHLCPLPFSCPGSGRLRSWDGAAVLCVAGFRSRRRYQAQAWLLQGDRVAPWLTVPQEPQPAWWAPCGCGSGLLPALPPAWATTPGPPLRCSATASRQGRWHCVTRHHQLLELQPGQGCFPSHPEAVAKIQLRQAVPAKASPWRTDASPPGVLTRSPCMHLGPGPSSRSESHWIRA